jgi:hypothetical protein
VPEKGKNGNRDYKAEYENYHAKPEQKKARAQRNAARAKYEKEHGVDLPSNVDVDHKQRIQNGGTNASSNLRARHESKNSAWNKGKKEK